MDIGLCSIPILNYGFHKPSMNKIMTVDIHYQCQLILVSFFIFDCFSIQGYLFSSFQSWSELNTGDALWEKLMSSPFHHPHLTSHSSVFETPKGKPGSFRAGWVKGAALESPGFSPGISVT
jgi:hypothetical protein